MNRINARSLADLLQIALAAGITPASSPAPDHPEPT